jgi:cellulose synthase/poly-beta-1,6-N-acetylglucosamine synthase-like glycosyltransferase
MLNDALAWFLTKYKWGLLFMGLYTLLVEAGNLLPRIRVAEQPPRTRFSVLIPAHNEELVIADLVANLLAMDYPRELVEVFVICDHCTDRTAQMAQEAGAVALVREGKGARGKGAALDWGLNQVLELRGRDHFDAFCVFDSDNRVATSFMRVMNNHLLAGHQALQSYLDTKNPGTNWITRVLRVEQRATNFLWHGGKVRWGLGNYMIGTGMCIKASLMAEAGWKVRSLTEDLEMTIKLALRGVRIWWVEETRVFDESPSNLKVIWYQRQRWAIGGWRCFGYYFLPCLWQGIRRLNVRLLDIALYLITPIWAVATLFYGVVSGLNVLFHFYTAQADPFLTWFGIAFGILYTPMGVLFSGLPLMRNIPFIAIYYLIMPALATLEQFTSLFRLNRRFWFHTLHKDKLDAEIQL